MTEGSIPAVVLAGGLARRMGGGDKGLRPLAGSTLLGHVVRRLRPQAAPLLLNANGDPARFAAFGLPVLPDPVAGHPGPLAGVLAAVEWAAAHGHDRVLTVPGDAPLLPPDLVARLSGAGPAAIVCAASGGRTQPVVALWSATLGPALRAVLESGERRVGAFAAAQGVVRVDWPVAGADPFLNVNTPGELHVAEALAADMLAAGGAS